MYYHYHNILPLLQHITVVQQSVVIQNEHNTCVLENLCKFFTQTLEIKPNAWSSTEM